VILRKWFAFWYSGKFLCDPRTGRSLLRLKVNQDKIPVCSSHPSSFTFKQLLYSAATAFLRYNFNCAESHSVLLRENRGQPYSPPSWVAIYTYYWYQSVSLGNLLLRSGKMASSSTTSTSEGFNINRTPFHNGEHYDFWKIKMKIFIKSLDVGIWKAIEEGPFVPVLEVEGRSQPLWCCEKRSFESGGFEVHRGDSVSVGGVPTEV
jgi:hypothetical protein